MTKFTSQTKPKKQRNWYKWKAWAKLRAHQLNESPLCAFCDNEGRVTPATVVDHIKPHRWSWSLFSDPDNLQSLCKRHHDSDKQIIEKGGNPVGAVGDDGWPLQETVPRKTGKR